MKATGAKTRKTTTKPTPAVPVEESAPLAPALHAASLRPSATWTLPPPSSGEGKAASLYDYARAVSDVDAREALLTPNSPPVRQARTDGRR